MDECIFCEIVNGKIPCHKIFEDEHVVAFLDIAKDAFGHTLVVPKNHAKDVFEVDEQTLCCVMNAVKKISQHYKSLGFDGVNIFNFSGREAGQSVFHLHFHIIPRKKNDGTQILINSKKVEQSLEHQQTQLNLFD